MGWAGALEAPSHGRFGMVPFVYVRVELMAARRAMRRPKQPREGRPCCFRRVRDQLDFSQSARSKKSGINNLHVVHVLIKNSESQRLAEIAQIAQITQIAEMAQITLV